MSNRNHIYDKHTASILYKNLLNKDEKIGFFKNILLKEYFIPKIYKTLFVKPYFNFSLLLNRYIEIKLIDNTIDKIGYFAFSLGAKLRPIQSGNLSTSLRLMIFGILGSLLFIIVLLVY